MISANHEYSVNTTVSLTLAITDDTGLRSRVIIDSSQSWNPENPTS